MKILQIESCSHCRYMASSALENRYYCSHCGDLRPSVVRAEDGFRWLPTWCPLEDAEPKDDNNG